MTADQIRAKFKSIQEAMTEAGTTEGGSFIIQAAMLDMVIEVAAQLAELNQAICDTNYLRVQIEPGQYPIVVSKTP
jgi:hypothetical protein